MKRFTSLLLASASSFLIASSISAQTVATDPVGFTTQSCLTNSDTLVSLPFIRPPAFVGAVASSSGDTITVSGTPFTSSPPQFVYAQGTQPNRYYVLIGPAGVANPKEGRIYFITGNTNNSLTVDITQDNLSGIPANAQVQVIPYATLASVFPVSDANVSFTPTTSTRSLKSQILIPDYTSAGTNLPYTATYYYISSGGNVGWRLFGQDAAEDHGDDILQPDGFMVVRQGNGAPTVSLTALGAVLTKKQTIPLSTSPTQFQDNAVSMVRPIDVALVSTGLSPSDGSFVETTSTRALKDQLFLYDNAASAINKSPSRTYFYFNGAWRLFGDDVANSHNADVIPAGSAIRIRKAPNATNPVFWTNSPTY